MKLTPQNVAELLFKCMFTNEEAEITLTPTDYTIGEGIKCRVGFHPQRLKDNTEEIVELISQLPESFHEDIGGGASFLNMCEDKEGNLWTGMHESMDQLVCLGTACGKLEYKMPRELWSVLPGGMPYIAIKK